MDRNPIDLRAIDPRVDDQRWEALLRRVNVAAAPELARRAEGAGGMMWVTTWARPVMAVAVVMTLVSVSVLRVTRAEVEATGVASVAEALGFPTPVAEWLADDRRPAEDDLLLALERRVRP